MTFKKKKEKSSWEKTQIACRSRSGGRVRAFPCLERSSPFVEERKEHAMPRREQESKEEPLVSLEKPTSQVWLESSRGVSEYSRRLCRQGQRAPRLWMVGWLMTKGVHHLPHNSTTCETSVPWQASQMTDTKSSKFSLTIEIKIMNNKEINISYMPKFMGWDSCPLQQRRRTNLPLLSCNIKRFS